MNTTQKNKKPSAPARRNEPPLKLYCLPSEREAIESNAALSGKPVSAFLRAAGMGMTPTSRTDQQTVREMLRINADLGRLGGLLKALLTHEERFDGYTGRQLHELTIGTVRDIQSTQSRLQDCIHEIFKGVMQ